MSVQRSHWNTSIGIGFNLRKFGGRAEIESVSANYNKALNDMQTSKVTLEQGNAHPCHMSLSMHNRVMVNGM